MHSLEPRTLGVTDYDMDAPLKAIRRLMLEFNGLITVAFRRSLIVEAKIRANTDLPEIQESRMTDGWLSSPYCQIEPAMAYQLGLPVLVLREKGVIQGDCWKKALLAPICQNSPWMMKLSITWSRTSGMP